LPVTSAKWGVGRRKDGDGFVIWQNKDEVVADHVTKDAGVVPADGHPADGGTHSHLLAGGAPAAAPRSPKPPAATRRVGYVVAVFVNGVLLWVVNQLLGWGWPPFLTKAFDELLPVIDLSLAATIVVNLLWAWRDPTWFRHLGQIGRDAISVAVVVRTWQVFPFDFSGSWSGWPILGRIVLAVAFFGLIIDMTVRFVGLVRAVRPPIDSESRVGTGDDMDSDLGRA
jgi:hypothetical protein